MKVVVDGLELYSTKNTYGIYLVCDSCGRTLDAPIVNDRISSDENKLRSLAKELGWTGEMTRNSENDLCPLCAKYS